MRDARAHVLGEAVLLEVETVSLMIYYSGFRFHSQICRLSPSLPDSTPPIRLSIGLSRICPEARCQAATQAAICHAKAARRRLLSSRSTVPAQGPTRHMHMLSTCCVVSSEVLYALAPAPLPEAMSRR